MAYGFHLNNSCVKKYHHPFGVLLLLHGASPKRSPFPLVPTAHEQRPLSHTPAHGSGPNQKTSYTVFRSPATQFRRNKSNRQRNRPQSRDHKQPCPHEATDQSNSGAFQEQGCRGAKSGEKKSHLCVPRRRWRRAGERLKTVAEEEAAARGLGEAAEVGGLAEEDGKGSE